MCNKRYVYYKFTIWYNKNKYKLSYNSSNSDTYRQTNNHKYNSYLYSTYNKNLFKNWYQNDKLITYINNHNYLFKTNHNQFSIFEQSDLNKIYTFNVILPMQSAHIDYNYNYNYKYNQYIDWTLYNAVTPVKNQYNCLSCWAFAAVGAIESAYYIKYNILYEFSVQQVIDCTISNFGCNGGYVDNVFINFKDGFCFSNDYPFTNYSKYCYRNCIKNIYSSLLKYNIIPSGSDYYLIHSLLTQPIVVNIHASDMVFHLYKDGIYNYECNGVLNHAILLVGFSNNYYKLKNSWGTDWGEKGYIKLIRDLNIKYGQCGILYYSLYPILK